MKTMYSRQVGFALLESLVALAVVVVGVLGVAKLNAVMLSGTGLSKTRAEAIQIAQQRMEAIRNFPLGNNCNQAPAGLPDTVTGINAQYYVAITFSNPLPAAPAVPNRVDAEVCVAWDGGTSCGSAPADKRVVLKSVLSCLGAGTSGLIAGSGTADTGGFVKTPTGAARVGGGSYTPGAVPGTANTISIDGLTLADGTKSYLNTEGKRELIDETTGKVLLTVDDGTEFSTISGKVYIEAKNGNPIVDPDGSSATSVADDNVFVMSSDASYCARYIPTTLPVVPTGATGNAIKYFYFYYKCYIGKGWWGNIGAIRTDNAPANDRVCVGDSTQGNDGTLWSKHPQLSTSRAYRGYRQVGTVYETTGIGIASDGVTYIAKHYPDPTSAHHDFLMTNITGAQTCATNMQLASPTLPLSGDQGKYFCLSPSCPASLTVSPTTPTTVIHGTITKNGGAALTGIDAANSACQPGTIQWADNGASYGYSCTLDWTGFTGGSWHGPITFTPVGTASLCAIGSSSVVQPTGSVVTYTINKSDALAYPNAAYFTDVPLAVTDVTLNFSAYATAASCGLGVPALSWTGTTNPKYLTWPAITGATGYKVYTCTTTNNNSLTACTPTALTTTTTALSYSPGDPGSKNTICVTVKSTDGVADSAVSATKCIFQKTGTYSYQ